MQKFLRFIAPALMAVLACAGCGSNGGNGGSASSDAPSSQPLFTPVRASDMDGQLLVSNYLGQALLILDYQTLTIKRTIAVEGLPLAVGFHNGKIYVGNETAKCVEVYSSSTGEKLFHLGDGPGSIPLPNDLSIDTKYGLVFVVDSNTNRIMVFSVDGPLLYTISDSSLYRPTAVVLDEAGEQLYVSAFQGGLSAAVLVFNYDGSYVRQITVSRPQGLALDGSGHLFMADALLGQVLVFDRASGREIQRLGSPVDFTGPHRLFLDVIYDGAAQKIFVTDYLGGRIETFATTEIAP